MRLSNAVTGCWWCSRARHTLMDLRAYFQKIRKVESELAEPFVVVVSRETADGGKPGVKTEVPRALAARLIVEDLAALASPEEAEAFRSEREQRRAEILEAEALLSDVPRAVRNLRSRGKRQ